jgi:hypothetical protein
VPPNWSAAPPMPAGKRRRTRCPGRSWEARRRQQVRPVDCPGRAARRATNGRGGGRRRSRKREGSSGIGRAMATGGSTFTRSHITVSIDRSQTGGREDIAGESAEESQEKSDCTVCTDDQPDLDGEVSQDVPSNLVFKASPRHPDEPRLANPHLIHFSLYFSHFLSFFTDMASPCLILA